MIDKEELSELELIELKKISVRTEERTVGIGVERN